MNYTQQAIERALEGGWEPKRVLKLTLSKWSVGDIVALYRNTEAFLLEKDFWRCLGRAEGLNGDGPLGTTFEVGNRIGSAWSNMMRDFTEHLIAGHDIESYFAQLLTKK